MKRHLNAQRLPSLLCLLSLALLGTPKTSAAAPQTAQALSGSQESTAAAPHSRRTPKGKRSKKRPSANGVVRGRSRRSALTLVSTTAEKGESTQRGAKSGKPVGIPARGNEPETIEPKTKSVSTRSVRSSSRTARTGSTTATAKRSWRERLNLTLNSSINGPSLGAIDEVSSISTQNTFVASYALERGWGVSTAFNFRYQPATSEAGLLDPWVQLANFQLVNRKGLSGGAFVRLIAPASPFSQSQNLMGRARIGLGGSYQFPKSRLSAGLFAFTQYHAYTVDPGPDATRMLLFAEPSLSFQATPTLSFSLLYDMGVQDFMHAPILRFGGASTGLIPALSWSPLSWLRVEPSLFLDTGNRISWDTTRTNLSISARWP